jgi:hypothetical protein
MKQFMNKISVPQLILEFVSVVFAVLFALVLNSRKQNADRWEDAMTIKAAILTECQKNKVKVDSILIKNEAYFNYLDSLVNLDPDDVTSVSFKYDHDLLTNAAWQLAQNNPASNQLEQDFLLDAAEIYQAQIFFSEFATTFFKNIGDYVIRQDETPPYNTALSLYFNLSVMINSSSDLSKAYNEFLNDYQEPNREE